MRNAATLIGALATRVGAVPPWERFAWCNQEAALVCFERPSYLGVRPATQSLAQCSSG